jgi:hypothetical protein
MSIMDFPAFARAIERRASAVDDQFSALKAQTRMARLDTRFHSKHPERRGLSRRNAALRPSRARVQERAVTLSEICATLQSGKQSLGMNMAC